MSLVILPKGLKLYRGDCRKTNWYALDKPTARLYGKKVCMFEANKTLRLFRLNHTTLKLVFKYLRPLTVKLLKFAFGTGTIRKSQSKQYRRLIGTPKKGGMSLNYRTLPGQRLSVSEIDTKALGLFARDFLTRNGYDGTLMPRKSSKFHKGTFHSEMFLTRPVLVSKKPLGMRARPHPSLQEMFVRYTSGTKRLQRAYGKRMIVFLTGGMAIKLYLGARNAHLSPKVRDTKDFDFKFAVPEPLRTSREIETYVQAMSRIMTSHMVGFIKYLNSRWGLSATLVFKEIQGVPLHKAGGPNIKKIYRVFNFGVRTRPGGPIEELVDSSLVVYPAVDREHLNLKFSRMFGMGIPKLKYLWKDTVQLLAGSFVDPSVKLRNPLYGDLKEKGLKNTNRARNLSKLVRKSRDPLVVLSKKLNRNIMTRNEASGEKDSRKILALLAKNKHRELNQKGLVH